MSFGPTRVAHLPLRPVQRTMCISTPQIIARRRRTPRASLPRPSRSRRSSPPARRFPRSPTCGHVCFEWCDSSGSVTSVGMTGDGIIFSPTVSGSPVTSSGTLAPQLLTQTANTVLAGPGSGPAATPTFRALAPADLPATISSNTTGNAATATALASTPAQCGSNNWATGISTSGNANCLQPGFSNLAGTMTLGQTPLTTAGDILFANSDAGSCPLAHWRNESISGNQRRAARMDSADLQ